MNIKLNKQTKRILMLFGVLLLLTGCAVRIEGPQDYYYLETTFSEVFADSKFSAIFVWPLAQLINLIVYKLNWSILAGIGITTFVVNAVTLPLTITAQKNQSKMQLLQPEINKVQAKYEGRNDQRSQMQMSAEIQNIYKKYDVNLGSSMIGMFIPFPILIAMFQSVQRASAVHESTILGNDMSMTILDGIKNGQQPIVYIILFITMGFLQFLATKVPQYLAKKRLEQERSYKPYDPIQSAPPQGQTMQYVMLGLIMFMALQWPTTMSIYWLFSSLMNILKSILADHLAGSDE